MPDEIVYECWITSHRGHGNTFAKIKTDARFELIRWFLDAITQADVHDIIHVVPHRESEYMHH